MWKVPAYTTKEKGVKSEYVDLESTHFPNGSVSVLVSTYPGRKWPMPFVYRVYLDPGNAGPPPLNAAAAKVFQRPWLGNIVIVRYSRSNKNRRLFYGNISRQEHELVFGVLGDLIERIWDAAYKQKV
ncbi:hypothetical protein DFP72DRAFT_851538 [Ephemerocybe angulata]|uniref:Uncharacterized protein n=1 Tax=Ephemerocybe angulata TaxID=980116 RepID=A0A8H6M422_9AGAR|nr:hypothetical protein DFP72DRAFT_851538 [Tulosesus angulatus]